MTDGRYYIPRPGNVSRLTAEQKAKTGKDENETAAVLLQQKLETTDEEGEDAEHASNIPPLQRFVAVRSHKNESFVPHSSFLHLAGRLPACRRINKPS
jgi:hypothetical protein